MLQAPRASLATVAEGSQGFPLLLHHPAPGMLPGNPRSMTVSSIFPNTPTYAP